VHNVLSDPPFTRVDLVCCRNLLIYLNRAGQAQVLRSLHFALNPGGMLFLGNSETVEAVDGLFAGIDKPRRLYRKTLAIAAGRALPPVQALGAVTPRLAFAIDPPTERPPLESLHDRVARRHAPPTVLVDADETVLHVAERAAHLLRVASGAPSNKLFSLARPELRAELRAALSRAVETGRAVEARRVRLAVNGEPRFVVMTVRPVIDELPAGLVLVAFEEFAETMAPDAAETGRDPVVDVLEEELRRTQARLHSMVGETAASTEELRASNEELQTINEELCSTTEELETSQEELQSINEELTTVNLELGLKVDETSRINDDLQNLMASAEIGVVFVDRELRVRRFSPQAASLMRLLPTDEGRVLTDIRHRLDYPELEQDVFSAMDVLHRVEREVQADDGRWFLARILPYRTSADRIEGAALAFVDVTRRRLADDALQHSENRMRMAAESLRDYAILTLDDTGVVATWSPGAERVFGFNAAEAVGQFFEFLFTEDDRRAGEPARELQTARDAGREEIDRWMVRKDGQRIFCSGITTPMVDGTLVGYAKIARDFTTERLRDHTREGALQEEQAARAALQKANAMKDEFLAVMSHELKNPLSVIQMNTQLLTRLPGLADDRRIERIARAMQSAVTSQGQIINDLLELSRLTTGKVALERDRLDLGEVVRTIEEAVANDIALKRQSLTVDVPGPIWVVADRIRTEQIVWNLITNASKFTPEGGSIRVSLTVQGAVALMTVADTGMGIQPDDLLRVFDMFRQVDRGASRRTTGLGIGLALVKQLAELHGGGVKAHSDGLQQGSAFTVWLPLADPPSLEVALPAEAPVSMTGLRLLLVDDEPDLLQAFAELISLEGAIVSTTSSATDALVHARDGSFDAIISDVAMPERDGYWLARELRKDPRLASIPLVAVSGMARASDKLAALEAGFDAHVGKPLDLDTLSTEVLAALTRRGSGVLLTS
jgi:two-component system CheB/CheR fusion protein